MSPFVPHRLSIHLTALAPVTSCAPFFFLTSVFTRPIIYIILGYTTLLVWSLRTYSDRESSFLLLVNGVGGGFGMVGEVWLVWCGWCGVGWGGVRGWGWVCLCSFDFVWRHVLCQTLLVLPVL